MPPTDTSKYAVAVDPLLFDATRLQPPSTNLPVAVGTSLLEIVVLIIVQFVDESLPCQVPRELVTRYVYPPEPEPPRPDVSIESTPLVRVRGAVTLVMALEPPGSAVIASRN